MGSLKHISHSQAFLIIPDPLLLLWGSVPPCSLTDVQTLSRSPLPHALGCTQPTIPSPAGASQLTLQAMAQKNLSTLNSTKMCPAPSSTTPDKHSFQLPHPASPTGCPQPHARAPAKTLETQSRGLGLAGVNGSGTQRYGPRFVNAKVRVGDWDTKD